MEGQRQLEATHPPVRDALLADLIAQVDALRRDARDLTDGLSATQLNWRPAPDRWSILQCLEHLTRTLQLYPAKVAAMVAEAQQRQREGRKPYRALPLTNWFIRGMEPPVSMRVRTMRSVNPPPDLDPGRVLADFDAAHAELASWIASADGVNLAQGRTSSPFAKIMRFTLGQVFALHAAHGRRHIWQARQVRTDARFPTA